MSVDPSKKFVDLGPDLPSKQDYLRGKALLQSIRGADRTNQQKADLDRDADPKTGNLYEHMVELIKLILELQPSHALDQFEDLSLRVKREVGGGVGGSGAGSGLVEVDTEARAPTDVESPPTLEHAKVERTLFQHPKHKWDEEPFTTSPLPEPWGGEFKDEDELLRLQDLGKTSFLVEQAGVGMGRDEMLRVWLSIRKLSLKLTQVAKLRFWGKLMATEGAYYIAEAEFEEGAAPDDGVPAPFEDWRPYNQEDSPDEQADRPTPTEAPDDVPDVRITNEAGEEETVIDNETKLRMAKMEALMPETLPKSTWAPRVPLPPEPRGKGVNRWDYFACRLLGKDEWFRLPSLRPEHVSLGRQTRWLFSGHPDKPLEPLPMAAGRFPGLEAHLLRAQIARVTASTWLAPAGLYQLDEEAELEEGSQPETLMVVEDFEALDLEELLEKANWQHTRPFVLTQGRCGFVAQKQAAAWLRQAIAEENVGLEDSQIDWIHPRTVDLWRGKFERQAQKELDDEGMEEEGGDDLFGGVEEAVEEGPGLLGGIDEDAALTPVGEVGLPGGSVTLTSKMAVRQPQTVTSWKTYPSSVLLPKNCSVAVVGSGRWPGAYSMARGADFVNLYCGWGHRTYSASFTPTWVEAPFKEFTDDAGLLFEAPDPTPLEEEAAKEAAEARRLARLAKAEEAEGQEEGEGDEDEDDED